MPLASSSAKPPHYRRAPTALHGIAVTERMLQPGGNALFERHFRFYRQETQLTARPGRIAFRQMIARAALLRFPCRRPPMSASSLANASKSSVRPFFSSSSSSHSGSTNSPALTSP
nr:hypothetical protein [Dickeya solani]